MATLRATIRKNRTNKDGECLVLVRYKMDQESVYFSTGVKVRPQNFDSKDQVTPVAKSQPGHTSMNRKIQQVKDKVDFCLDEIRLERLRPDPWLVKLRVENLDKEQTTKTADFYTLFDKYISDSEKVRSHTTIKAYKVARKILNNFDPKLRIQGITLITYDDLVRWMAEQDYTNNYIGTIVKRLKSFLRYAKKNGYKVHPDIDHSDFKILRETPTIVYLTQSEFEALRDLKLPTGKYYDRVRDLAILGCRTGLRYSDIHRLGPQHFQGEMITMRIHKNKSRVMIPMAAEVRQIAQKYASDPPKMTDVKFNETIKKVAQKAKITTPVEVSSYSGGRKEYKTVPKWKLLSSHVMVKTFITHAGERGMSAKTVSEITGKTVKVILQHYYGTNTSTIKTEMERAFG